MARAPEDTCATCGQWTRAGREKLHAEHKSIYGVDFSRRRSELLAEIRGQFTKLRGQLWDIRYRWPAFEGLQSVEGLLTCGIVTLFYEIEEMKKHEARFAEQVSPDQPQKGEKP